MLPEKVREGITLRRIVNGLRSPSLLIRNLRFWWNEEVSSSEHIFVVGPPRNGTTLVKNVLRSHSEICGVDRETRFFLRKNFADFRHPSDIKDDEMKDIISKSKSIVGLFDNFANRIKQKKGKDIFLEKTPEHALRMDYIINHFPKSKVIFVIRDPRDSVRSAKNVPNVWSTFANKNKIKSYMSVWKNSLNEYDKHKSRVMLVKYESFCENTNECLSRMMNFIDLSPEVEQLHPTSYGNTVVSEAESHLRLREPITAKSVGRWKKELSREEVCQIEESVASEMRELGYSLTQV